MAIARHDHHPGRPSQQLDAGHSRSIATGLQLPGERKKTPVSNRIKWMLAAVLLGAAAGWTVFRAFLTLITLD